MAQYYTGTLLASPIVRGSSGDTYGTHHSVLGVGGYMEVNTLANRNALPVDTVNGLGYDGISSGQRRFGMLVYVREEDTIYQLYIPEVTWSGLTNASKVLELSNNSNWRVFVSGEDSDISGERIYKEFSQVTHGFSVGDVLGYNGTDFVEVNTTTAATVEPLGIVTKVIDANTFNLTFSGLITTAGITDVSGNTISGGTVYYLSSTSGKISPEKPTSFTELSKPMLVGLSGGTAVVLQYRGIYETITSGGTVSYTEFTGYTATTQAFLDTTVTGATNIGFFTGLTGVQTLPIDHLSDNTLDGNYVSQYNYYYRDSDGYIRIGAPSGKQPRRGYVRQTEPKYSWVWNEYTGDSANIGWLFVRADVTSDDIYGTQVTGSSNVTTSIPPYTGISWNEGQVYNNGSNVTINTVIGNLGTGDTYNVGGPVYSDKQDQKLRLRTIVTESPRTLSVEYDEYFIKLSGATPTGLTSVSNVGTGIGVYSGTSGNTLLLKSLIAGDNVTINDGGDSITISSTGSGGTTTGGSGENVTKTINKAAHGFTLKDVIGFSGGTYNKVLADGNYDGEIIGIVTDVINTDSFKLTQSGYVTGLTTLSASTTYFVSPTVAGALTPNAPSTYGQLVRPIFIANSTTTGWVLPYPGYVLTPPVTGGTGGTEIFTEDITVSIDPGKTFGRYENGDTIPATGLTPKEVIILACFEGKTPTVNLSSSGNDVAFGESGKTVNLNFSYTINTLNATVASVLLEWRRGNTGSWTTLVTNTGATSFTHNVDDSANRFNTAVINYRYTVVDSEGITGVTTHNVTPQAYAAPTITSTLNGTVTAPETQTNREKGNVDSLINGSITSNRSLVNITDWTLERRYDGGSWTVLSSGSSLSTLSVSIPSYDDNTLSTSVNSIDYRITYIDEYTSGTGGAKSISFGFFNYAGVDTNTSLLSAQIIALNNEQFATSTSRTHTYTTTASEYAYYAYPATYPDVNTITMLDNGMGSPITITGAFQKLSNVGVTNSYGVSQNYKVYRSNAPGAFSSDIVTFT